jgi:hypothetical protein
LTGKYRKKFVGPLYNRIESAVTPGSGTCRDLAWRTTMAGSSFPFELLLEASIVGADDDGFDLEWQGGVRGRYEPEGGLTAKDYERFGLEPPEDDRAAGAGTTTSPAAGSLLQRDSTGLWHAPDFSVCRSSLGPPICLDPLGAKIVAAFNSWRSQGLVDVKYIPLLREMARLSQGNPALSKRINGCYYKRPDHLFRQVGLWRTLVGPGRRRGTYRLLL